MGKGTELITEMEALEQWPEEERLRPWSLPSLRHTTIWQGAVYRAKSRPTKQLIAALWRFNLIFTFSCRVYFIRVSFRL